MAPKSSTNKTEIIIMFIHPIIYLPNANILGNFIASTMEIVNSYMFVNNFQNKRLIGWLMGEIRVIILLGTH